MDNMNDNKYLTLIQTISEKYGSICTSIYSIETELKNAPDKRDYNDIMKDLNIIKENSDSLKNSMMELNSGYNSTIEKFKSEQLRLIDLCVNIDSYLSKFPVDNICEIIRFLKTNEFVDHFSKDAIEKKEKDMRRTTIIFNNIESFKRFLYVMNEKKRIFVGAAILMFTFISIWGGSKLISLGRIVREIFK